MVVQTILFPNPNICDVEELYFHRDGGWLCFDGYFNLFYLEKHHKYSNIDELTLELEVSGIDSVVIMHNRDEIRRIEASCNDKDSGKMSLRLPYNEYDKGVFWFKARKTKNSGGFSVEGHFEAKSENFNEVNLAVNICTFQREAYVLRNMKSLLKWADCKRPSEASKHVQVFIVDNGKSLNDNREFVDLLFHNPCCNIQVIPNNNTGGAGGFKRGMVEAMRRRDELKLTHILMMDDDAVFDPDLFVRLYGFLSCLKREYKLISVGGALFREDYKYIQHASGEWFRNFKIINEHPLVDMRNYDNATAGFMIGTEHERDRYGAWWCCCYPMEVITEENLPLPLFVHHDDIQFGMKLAKSNGVVFLNGINVWHQGFELAFTGVKQYYNTRNELITMMMFYPDSPVWVAKYRLIRRIIGMLVCMRYGDIELIHKAVEDYKKGTDWLYTIDVEALHKEVAGIYKNIVPFKKIEELQISDKHKEQLLRLTEKYDEVITPDQLREYYNHNKYKTGLWKKVTVNGWLLPAVHKPCLVTPLDSPWKSYRCRYAILYQPSDKKCAIMQKDMKWFWKSVWYCLDILIYKV